MPTPVWPHFPLAAAEPQGRSWLALLGNLGRSPATVDAYGRGLDQYLRFCRDNGVDASSATLEHVSLFVRHLNGEGENAVVRLRVSNATLQQRLTAVRLWYDHLVYQGLRELNPVPRGQHAMVRGPAPEHAGFQRGLVRRLVRLPRIPSEPEWARLLAEAAREGPRNRLMFALAHYGALRREELVGLRVADLDVAHRLVTVRPETSKSGRARVVCYAAEASPALAAHLVRRRTLHPGAGPMFLSESDRNPRRPLTVWTWSKVVRRLAQQAGVDRLTVGGWALASAGPARPDRGKPLAPNSKRAVYHAVRRFLGGVRLWGWAKLRCSPRFHVATPASVLRLSGVNPRTIDDAVWLKLVWASLNLRAADRLSGIHYPVELLRAVAVVWTHAGLRGNEILRLRLGCARAQDDDVVDEAGGVTPAGTLCWLDVPAGKTSKAHAKPVGRAAPTRRARAIPGP